MRMARLAVGLLTLAALVAAGKPSWPTGLPVSSRPAGESAVPPATEQARVELGRRLFYDADLSRDGTMACATCHEQKHAFADGNRTHPGVTGEPGRRNVPGLANVRWIAPLTFADPAQTTLEAQVAVPVFGTHPVEMGMKGLEGEIAVRLGRDDCYVRQFRSAFPREEGRIDPANVARALAAFERTLVSFGSAFDRGTLSPDEGKGRAVFARDCAACHAGPLFTDRAYHRLDPLDPAAPDQGLFEATGRAGDRARFRTPSLRNVLLTGPWWHDGGAGTIEEALRRHRRPITPADMAALVAFLGALSDPAFTTRADLAMPDKACGRAL